MRTLTLCGSLRASSSNRAILRAFECVGGSRIECTHYESMGDLPHFNPDLDGEGAGVPHEVATLRELVDFYDRRYNIGFSEQERQDLVNFLGAL